MKNISRIMRFANKPDSIVRNIPTSLAASSFGDKYRDHLLSLPRMKITSKIKQTSFLPFHSFKHFPKETMTKIIDDSFQILKDKVDPSSKTFVYNLFMSNYLSQNIEFDIKTLLNEMNSNNIPFNQSTYQIIIEIYSRNGEMKTVEDLVATMISKGVNVSKQMQISMITGYIISGQLEKMKQLLKDNNLKEDDYDVLFGQGHAYAILGDVEKLINVINVMKEKNYDIKQCNLRFYWQLAASNDSIEKVEEFSKSFIMLDEKVKIKTLICFLNRNGYYSKSLIYAEKYHDIIRDALSVAYLLSSFNSVHCPVNIYKSVLKLFANELKAIHKNLFQHMGFDDALQISQAICNDVNGNCLATALQDKAISENSIGNIKHAIGFTTSNLKWRKLNLQLRYAFIPHMLQSGIVSDTKALLELLPQYTNFIFPSVLMYHLCNGQYAEYNSFIPESPIHRKLNYDLGWLGFGLRLVENISFKELDRFASEAMKMFNDAVVVNMLSNYVYNFIINSIDKNNNINTNEITNFVEKYDLEFNMDNIEYLKKTYKNHSEFFDSLPVRSKNHALEYDQSEFDQDNIDQMPA